MNQNSGNHRHVTVIGAGIVGMSCALHLLREGHQVRVIDRLPPGEGCSYGNAGLFADYSFVPLSLPGVLANVPKWLLDPLGPLAIRWRHAPKMLSWLLRFVRAGRPQRVAEICDALSPLLSSALEEHLTLARGTDAEGLIRTQGYMYVYEDAVSAAKEVLNWRLRIERGADVREIGADEIMVIGGERIYRDTLPVAGRIYLTEVLCEADGNAYFPELDEQEWVETARENGQQGAGDDHDYNFVVLDKKS